MGISFPISIPDEFTSPRYVFVYKVYASENDNNLSFILMKNKQNSNFNPLLGRAAKSVHMSYRAKHPKVSVSTSALFFSYRLRNRESSGVYRKSDVSTTIPAPFLNVFSLLCSFFHKSFLCFSHLVFQMDFLESSSDSEEFTGFNLSDNEVREVDFELDNRIRSDISVSSLHM